MDMAKMQVINRKIQLDSKFKRISSSFAIDTSNLEFSSSQQLKELNQNESQSNLQNWSISSTKWFGGSMILAAIQVKNPLKRNQLNDQSVKVKLRNAVGHFPASSDIRVCKMPHHKHKADDQNGVVFTEDSQRQLGGNARRFNWSTAFSTWNNRKLGTHSCRTTIGQANHSVNLIKAPTFQLPHSDAS